MRGADHQQSGMFSYISAERRVPQDHPLRAIRAMVDVALRNMGPQFDAMYAQVGRPSIAPEKLLRALLLQVELQFAVPLVCGNEHRRSGVGRDRVHQKS